MSETIEIAALLTCYNRRDKTVSCIKNVLKVLDYYNGKASQNIRMTIYLTDDGCSDGTADAVRSLCKGNTNLHIVNGNGSLYWAGGMRLAWREALKEKDRWMFYLLLNDDTDVLENVLFDLFQCHEYSLREYHRPGLYSGITAAKDNINKITYGGDIYTTSSKTLTVRLKPSGQPQIADIITANILMVPKQVVDEIGIFYEGFIHSGADNDYSVMARKHNIKSFVTPNVCGLCDDDHIYDEEECKKLMKMTLGERRKYVLTPTRSDKDYLLLVRRTIPKKYPISIIMRLTRLFFPALYYKINVMRGYYKK